MQSFSLTALPTLLSTICCPPPQIHTPECLIHRFWLTYALRVLHNCQLRALQVSVHRKTTQQRYPRHPDFVPFITLSITTIMLFTIFLSAPGPPLAYSFWSCAAQFLVRGILILFAVRSMSLKQNPSLIHQYFGNISGVSSF